MAGSRIKGITVEIGGDTTKLQTALSTWQMEKVLNSSSHSSGLSGMVGAACFANKEVMSMVGSMLAAMQANKGEICRQKATATP